MRKCIKNQKGACTLLSCCWLAIAATKVILRSTSGVARKFGRLIINQHKLALNQLTKLLNQHHLTNDVGLDDPLLGAGSAPSRFSQC